MPLVAVLPEVLINQIAAGEVVERPASVVKELGENALDAGARAIRVFLGEGGLRAIRVEDDGCGMSREDAELSLLRHATSKLRDLEGLSAIQTQGFRGEALPAIASVSRFTLLTARPGDAVGTRISVEGGGGLRVEDAPPATGTSIRVDDLFFNTPARRKFMRRASTELIHCREAVVRLALGHPEVSFSLEHDGQRLFTSTASGGDVGERLAAVLGPEVHPHLMDVDERRLGLRVWGVTASPDFTLSNARGLYTFVNGRYVRDRGLNFAVQRAFRDVLPMGRQPVAALFIELDPAAVDVNVHPQKLEVRFADGAHVAEAVFTGLRRALQSVHPVSTEQDSPAGGSEAVPGAQYAWAVEQFLSRAREEGNAPSVPPPAAAVAAAESPASYGGPAPVPPPGAFSTLRPMGVLANRFWICEGVGGTLSAVDPHAALERVFLSDLLRAPKAEDPPQSSLFKVSLDVGPPKASRLLSWVGPLKTLGVILEPFGPGAVALTLPVDLDGPGAVAWVEELLAHPPAADEELISSSARTLACRAAGHAVRHLHLDRAAALFRRVEAADHRIPCRHGRVVVFEISYLELEGRAR